MAIWDKVGKAVAAVTQNVSENSNKPKKCPACGQSLNGGELACPMCGYDLSATVSSTSVSDLAAEIGKLEQKRNTVADALATKLSGRRESPTDEKIASLIRNYVIPNTKTDILEFMLLAAGNIDAKLLAGKKNVEGLSELVTKAWESKFQQAFQKAKISFGTDNDFRKIQAVYDSKLEEIEAAKPRSIFSRRK